jgi:ribosomal protein L11 methyltransferase
MDYLEYEFNLEPVEPWRDVLQAELGDLGFESFVDTDNGVKAYIQVELHQEGAVDQTSVLTSGLCDVEYKINKVESKNWNEEWEKNFQPIEVNDRCVIRAPFHDSYDVDYEIIIEPKMSFGTGHHETTHMLVDYILEMDNLKGAKVMDMGCGTGILAILTAMKGAGKVDAVDVDNWAYENTVENAQRNDVAYIKAYHNDASILKGGEDYDLFIANINRNILVNDMDKYVKSMKVGSHILFSGFYTHDNNIIIDNAQNNGLELVEEKSRNNWSSLKMIKK